MSKEIKIGKTSFVVSALKRLTKKQAVKAFKHLAPEIVEEAWDKAKKIKLR